MSQLPENATVVIVGAGPAGLACAISLIGQGCRDIVVVDAVLQGENTSRAMVIHAATLEALETIGCADDLVKLGIQSQTMNIRTRTASVMAPDFASLAQYTRFPFALILPQNITERVLGEHLQSLGVPVFRPLKVSSMKAAGRNDDSIDVCFEGGEVIRAKYVIGADGARSTVRQLAGIGFADPDGLTADHLNSLSQMILADVVFDNPPENSLPTNTGSGVLTDVNLFIIAPLPWSSPASQSQVYRIGCGVPAALGTPPPNPPLSYLQTLVDKYGPLIASRPLQISQNLWSTRFRTHSAIAERIFVRFDGQSTPTDHVVDSDPKGAAVVLIGDAAHIHSPAGGQGMNLGIRDAVALGPVIATHLDRCKSSAMPVTGADEILHEYASTRRARALNIIRMTKTILAVADASGEAGFISKYTWWFPFSRRTVRVWFLRLLGHFGVMRRFVAWRLSGLDARY